MREGWDTGLEQFDNLSAYYTAVMPDVRQQSGESDFGIYWYEGAQAWSPSWRISAVKNTGEIYAVKIRDDTREGRATVGRVVVLGSVGPETEGYAKAEAVLAGWAQVCGLPESLQWAVDRVRLTVGMPAVAPIDDADEIPAVPASSSSLGEVAGRCVLLLEALKPWASHGEQVKREAVELTLALAKLPVDDPEEEAFKRGVLQGIAMYAYTSSEPWAENGVQYVGTTGTTLKLAKERFLEEHASGSLRVADPGKSS